MCIIFNRITNLVPADSGSPCHPDNVAVIVSEHKPHQLRIDDELERMVGCYDTNNDYE